MRVPLIYVVTVLYLLTSACAHMPEDEYSPTSRAVDSYISLADDEVVEKFGQGFEEHGCRCYSAPATNRYLSLCLTSDEYESKTVWRATYGDAPECRDSSPAKMTLPEAVSRKGLAIGDSIERVRALHGVPDGIRRAESLDGGPLPPQDHQKLGGYEESFPCSESETCAVLSVFLRDDTVSAISAWLSD